MCWTCPAAQLGTGVDKALSCLEHFLAQLQPQALTCSLAVGAPLPAVDIFVKERVHWVRTSLRRTRLHRVRHVLLQPAPPTVDGLGAGEGGLSTSAVETP